MLESANERPHKQKPNFKKPRPTCNITARTHNMQTRHTYA